MSAVRVDRAGPTARITLARPDAGNAVDLAMARAIRDAAAACADDDDVRCVVLRAEGRRFCVGGDIAEFAAAGEDAPALLHELATTVHRGVVRLARMRKPLLVLVNGPAAGVGLSLALLGDIVLASASAHFTAAYGAIGLTPDGGMSWLLQRHIGLRRAQAMILTNQRVGAVEAAAIGLVTRVVEDADLVAEGETVAAQLVSGPTAAIGVARNLILDAATTTLEAHLDREAEAIAAAGGAAEAREGVAAFVERRRPDFAGPAGSAHGPTG